MACLPAAANALNIVQGNDDGWAEINIRALYEKLTNAGLSAIISAPAENKSGTGSTDAPPTTVGSDGCEFNSCPAGSPPTGNNASMPRFNVRTEQPSPEKTEQYSHIIVCQFLPGHRNSLWYPEPLDGFLRWRARSRSDGLQCGCQRWHSHTILWDCWSGVRSRETGSACYCVLR